MKKESYADTATELLRFSIPMILGAVFQQMFSWADALIVGNFAGEQALAAIGTTTSCVTLLMDLILGAAAGITILAARFSGAGEREKVRRLTVTFLRLIPFGAGIAAVIGILSAGALMRLLATPAEILSQAVLYLRWMYAGTVFLAVYNTLAAILRGLGNSRAPFLAVTAAGTANVILDYLLVAGLHLGIGGAAAATVATQTMMAVFLLVYTWRNENDLLSDLQKEKPDRQMFREGMHYALPLMIQGTAASVGKVVLTGFRNGFGIAVIAAVSTAYRVDTVLISPVRSLGAAVAARVSAKLGAGREDKARQMFGAGLVMGMAFAAVMTGFVMVFGSPLIGIFGVSDEVRLLGSQFFRHLGQFYIICAVMEVMHGYLQGRGMVRFAAANLLFQLGVRIVLSYRLKNLLGWPVIAYAEGFSWCAAVLSAAACIYLHRKTIRE